MSSPKVRPALVFERKSQGDRDSLMKTSTIGSLVFDRLGFWIDIVAASCWLRWLGEGLDVHLGREKGLRD